MLTADREQVRQAHNNAMFVVLNAIQANASSKPHLLQGLAETFRTLSQCLYDFRETERDFNDDDLDDLGGDFFDGDDAPVAEDDNILNAFANLFGDKIDLVGGSQPVVDAFVENKGEVAKVKKSENTMFAIRRKSDDKWYGHREWVDKRRARFYKRRCDASNSLNYAWQYTGVKDDYDIVQFDLLEREAA